VDPAGPGATLGRCAPTGPWKSLRDSHRLHSTATANPLDRKAHFSDTTSTRVAGFEVFPGGRFSLFGDIKCDVQRLGEEGWKQDAVLDIMGHVKASSLVVNRCLHTDSSKSGGFYYLPS